jgi:hypothetical protein
VSTNDPTATPAPSDTATRTVQELIQALTSLAGELPRGLDTPVEVGLVLDRDTFDTSAAFSVEAITATWPGFRPDGAECRHTTLSLIGDRDHPDADRYSRHEPAGAGSHPDWEDPPTGAGDARRDDAAAVEDQDAEPLGEGRLVIPGPSTHTLADALDTPTGGQGGGRR